MQARDLTVLAQLHAALDSMVEAETALRAVNASGFVPPAMQRLQQLVLESRELLRSLLRVPRVAS